MVEDRGGTAGATLAAPGEAYEDKADTESGEGRADFGSAAVSSRQLFLLLCGSGTLPCSWCQYGVGKSEASSAPHGMRSALSVCYCCLVGSGCLKSAPFAVDDERDMVASRSMREGLTVF